ncbi:MAG TPA: hypothetical protein VGB00_15165 [Pyrinomonadaceae bacterium]|jgi:hypothetical protein
MQSEDYGDKTRYIVAAMVGTNYEACIVAAEDDMIIATHTRVFGPASREECERWRDKNCKQSSAA